jgi:DNA invertase Pin-like site-specific DNA recombinase
MDQQAKERQMSRQRRAIGLIRVSDTAGRNGERFASPQDQRDRIEQACEREGLTLLRVEDELDVSGGKPLAKRKGLRSAVEAIEAGEAEVIVVAYQDRLARSLEVELEVIRRVEAANGDILADAGMLTGASTHQWLSGVIHGAMNESYRRTIKERSGAATQRAIDRGVLPYPNVPAGYERNDDGKLIASEHAPAVAEAFRIRADGATIETVTKHLRENGVQRSWYGVQKMLSSRVYLGEIHFGHFTPNLDSHPAIVPADVWRRVQTCEAKRGPRPKSERLLARLGVLRCASCGTKLTASGRTTAKKSFPNYRCPSMDCTDKVAISAKISEQVVTDAVRAALADIEGRASAETNVREADQELEQAEQALGGAVTMLTGLENVPETQKRLSELREARDEAQSKVDQLGGTDAALSISADRDWDVLTVDEQRALIRATVQSAEVSPGRGADRIAVSLFVS